MADTIKQFSFRITEDSLYALKKAAIERRTTPTELAKKVLADWWKTQPEGKLGPLFPEETTEEATPVATKEAPKKTAAKEADAATTFKKAPKKSAAKKS